MSLCKRFKKALTQAGAEVEEAARKNPYLQEMPLEFNEMSPPVNPLGFIFIGGFVGGFFNLRDTFQKAGAFVTKIVRKVCDKSCPKS